jgi:hypothetical protein
MATSAMDPNRIAAAPYEPTAGAQRLGLGSLRRDPLIGAVDANGLFDHSVAGLRHKVPR